MNKRPLLLLSRSFFFLGVIMGLALAVVLIWNNLESANYYFKGIKYAPFKGLHCPVILSTTEKGIVTAVFKNPTNETDHFYYRAEVSGRAFSKRTLEDQVVVPPHQSASTQFAVDANDVDLRFFILVKITILPNSVRDAREATCGIMVANLPGLKGSQVSMAALFLSLSGIAVGLGLWQPPHAQADRGMRHVAQALGLGVVLTLLAAYMGWWAIAIALTATIVLLLVISLHLVLA